MRSDASSGAISGVRALGTALGVSHQTAHEYVRHPDWPFGPGPWRRGLVPRMRTWRDGLPGRVGDDDAAKGGDAGEGSTDAEGRRGTLTEARRLVALTQARKTQVEIDIKLGRYHDAATCRHRRVAAIESAKQELLGLADGLPFDDAVKNEVRSRIEDLLRRFADGYAADAGGTPGALGTSDETRRHGG